MPPEFSLPRSSVQVIEHDQARYRLLLAWPHEPPPPAGYPIVYLLDADIAFATTVEMIRQRSRRPDATGVPPTVVAGLGLVVERPEDKTRRTFDFTPAGLVLPEGEPAQNVAPVTGGGGRFRAWLTGDVRTIAEDGLRIDASRRTLFGHSLGGFFVLNTLFAQPSAFSTFVAASPSIWWDADGVMARADQFARTATGPAPGVLLTAGEYEQTLAPWQPASAFTESVRDRRDRRRMVDHVVELAHRLAPLNALGGAVECVQMPGEDHASVVPLTLSHALRFGPGMLR